MMTWNKEEESMLEEKGGVYGMANIKGINVEKVSD